MASEPAKKSKKNKSEENANTDAGSAKKNKKPKSAGTAPSAARRTAKGHQLASAGAEGGGECSCGGWSATHRAEEFSWGEHFARAVEREVREQIAQSLRTSANKVTGELAVGYRLSAQDTVEHRDERAGNER